jgi:hypothetical protein
MDIEGNLLGKKSILIKEKKKTTKQNSTTYMLEKEKTPVHKFSQFKTQTYFSIPLKFVFLKKKGICKTTKKEEN